MGDLTTNSLAEVGQERVGQEARVEPIQKPAFLWGFIPRIPVSDSRASEPETDPKRKADHR